MSEELKVGDFVYSLGDSYFPRIVVVPNAHEKYARGPQEVGVLPLMYDAKNYKNHIIFGGISGYDKITPTKELIEDAKEKLEKSLLGRRLDGFYYVDNLTYVEICSKLREYEQELGRI